MFRKESWKHGIIFKKKAIAHDTIIHKDPEILSQ